MLFVSFNIRLREIMGMYNTVPALNTYPPPTYAFPNRGMYSVMCIYGLSR